MPRRSAQAELDGLRQELLAQENVRVREFEAEVAAAKAEVEEAGRAVTDSYAAENEKAMREARKRERAAVEKLEDLQHRLAGAVIRAERAGQRVDAFQTERAEDLLGEAEDAARETTLNPAARSTGDRPLLASVQAGQGGDSAARQPRRARRRPGERAALNLRLGGRVARTRARAQAGRRPRAAAGSLAREGLATPRGRDGEAPPRRAGGTGRAGGRG
jgi:hypothetical protein